MGEKSLGPTPAARGSWATPAPIRAAFFDVDGTMLSLSQDAEPASTREAIRRLAEAGVMPILATGRTHYLLDKVDLADFKAFVTFNGQLVEVGGRTVHSNPLDPRDVETAVRQTQAGLYNCLFMERGRMYAHAEDDRLREMTELTHNHYEAGDVEQALRNDVYQLNLFVDPGEERVLLDQTRHCKATRWSDVFADVMPDSGGKDVGVRIVMEELGLAPEECVAFGDGGNDVDMFRAVGTSVAMGNGNDEALAAATYVTDHVDDDGIWNACARLGLL
ncbi:Cof-type HAD-IIB family hydrolase [Olsenella sp. SW781]|uniref:Cof-type HAD-IIB family hydrolase n=1 Tax=Olsenella sp. SW781 TaxID=2530046 RepID=UPI00336C1C78